ncbi:antitoxin Xre/MbcA/ParS toxin-binding domain-containing protein [Pseudomonas sp. ZT5P21]
MLSFIEEYKSGAPSPAGIWAQLGIPNRGSALHERIREGLPFSFLEQLAKLVQIEMRLLSEGVGISRSLLGRRMKTGRLTLSESDRLISFMTVYERDIALFESDSVATSKWMITPLRALGSRRPLDMLGTRAEANAVLDLIGRLEMGVLV